MTSAAIYWVFIITINILFGGLYHQVDAEGQFSNEEDANFQSFLHQKLSNYTVWLSGVDPLPPTVESVSLTSKNETNDGVDANLTISNYYMSGHSRPFNSSYNVFSYLNNWEGKTFTVDETHVYQDQPLIFGGDYTVNGTILVNMSSEEIVSFQGKGRWRLEADLAVQVLRVVNYTVTEDDYIDLDVSLENKNNYGTAALMIWNNIEFEGLTINDGRFQISENGTGADELMHRVHLALAETFQSFLHAGNGYPINQRPLMRVLVAYLKEVFAATTFSDIIA